MGTQVKAVYDWFEKAHINATLMLITPDVEASALMDLDSSRNYHMVNALYANDPANPLNISLENIYQVRLFMPDGGQQSLPFSNLLGTVKMHLSPGSTASPAYPYRISNEGLSDPEVIEAWWAVERARPDAVQNLVSAARHCKPGTDGRILLDRVTAFYTGQEATLCAAPPTLETLESLEALLGESQGILLKNAKVRCHDLTHAKELKGELRARDEFQQCMAMLHSNKSQDRADAKDGLGVIASQSPTTVYGQKAAARLQLLNASKSSPASN